LRIATWNPAATRIYGWTEDEALGKHVDVLLRTQWFKQQQEEARTILQEEGAWKGEVRQKSKDGRDLIIEASVSWIRDADGNAVGGVTANRDMTAQEALSNRLLRERNLLQGILDSSLDHLVVVDSGGFIREANRSWLLFAADNGANEASCSIGASYLEPVQKAVQDGDVHAIHFEQEFSVS
jgi:PAS domain S-box-containing protein